MIATTDNDFETLTTSLEDLHNGLQAGPNSRRAALKELTVKIKAVAAALPEPDKDPINFSSGAAYIGQLCQMAMDGATAQLLEGLGQGTRQKH